MNHLKITTDELAKICGVSQGTVDRALNNRSDIKKETKEKILSVAKLYGYRQSIVGEPCYKGQIGIIVFNLNNEYFSELIMNTEKILREIGFGTVIMLTHYDKALEIECIRNMYNMGVKGIILCSVNNGEEFNEYLKMIDIPVVAVGNNIGGIPYVGTDDFAAMRDMTKKAVADGYKRPLYFSPALKYPDSYAQQERYRGFLAAAEGLEHAVTTDTDELLSRCGNADIIICSTDYYAFQVLSKIKTVRVTGFDNLKTIEKYKINISSVGYSIADIAQSAVDVIMNDKKENVILPHYLTECGKRVTSEP